MEKKYLKEKARYAFIRERTKQLKERPRHTFDVPGHFTVQEPGQEEESSAADQVQRAAEYAAHSTLLYAKRQHRRNTFHRETYFEELKPTKEPWRQETVNEYKKKAGSKAEKPVLERNLVREKQSPQTHRKDPEQKALSVKEQGRRLAQRRIARHSASGTQARASVAARLKSTLSRSAKKTGGAALLTGGGIIAVILPLILILAFAALLYSGGGAKTPVSEEVNAYTPLIQLYAKQHGIPQYVELIKAVMMQESGGRGSDPMQASECSFNTRYPNTPGGITDPEYSVNVGIQNLAASLAQAGVESPIDIEHISLALQGYNYGNGYIRWALENYGGYSAQNAAEFSDMMAARLGWSGYGDRQYVSHVLRYYPISGAFMGGGQAMVEVALTQVGNVGGQPYWTWYGYNYRVEWCAIFVSWCAEQCGYIDAGLLPRFEGVRPGAEWFKERDQWQGLDYAPRPGDIIFFDWENDGLADHVGIVKSCENGVVLTIEGNSGDACRENSYPVGSTVIYGYGVPVY